MKKLTIDELYLQMFATYDDILSVDDVAVIMNLDKKRVYRMLRSGEINSIKFDRWVRVPKLWLIEYIQKYGFQRQQRFHEQRRAAVALYCQTPRSRKQIQEFLDLSDRKFFRDTVLHPLLEEGVIRMTIPEYPGHVKQRYVTVRPYESEDSDDEN